MEDRARLGLGIAFGVAAGALWGLVFLAPELARDFTALQLAAGRYLVYGLISAGLLVPRWRPLRAWLEASHWRGLVGLSLLGNIVYYVLLASAVQWGGVAMTSLVIGFLPVAVTLIGTRVAAAVPLRRLAPSLWLSAFAIGCIAWQAMGGTPVQNQPHRLAGLLCAIGALASWTTYAVINARWLIRLEHVSAHDWNLLTGVVTGALALLLVPAAMLVDTSAHDGAAWLRFAAISTGIAVFASILGNGLWNRMSRLLPLTLVGQMILFETLFALLYGFFWERRLPTPVEILAIVALVTSVLLCVRVHRPDTA
ncbi:multidrug DMT transporter permease [Luteibacter rhizovicinus DSM 16549]|uniref:Multidrug DMT transporter permease n=1 Tax=Luteibacter rhizovicinus DSM 16549 TaxID=1440763 RepID=A0A0G9HCI1_9GAMM|nr:DMT family transporter [Luteibacter rhizovicinus]APG05028.1 multidrug DMT transporter permease [Luteibacter rhizovicinus DSM 16549]KLD67470.1 multidrug DMT transporter permease [Luteibacter rhizovicinus DSM 16549]KLD76664.1 multidrug DMT transporter permease [Xanthomonas hyacinthi DSM 19077]